MFMVILYALILLYSLYRQKLNAGIVSLTVFTIIIEKNEIKLFTLWNVLYISSIPQELDEILETYKIIYGFSL